MGDALVRVYNKGEKPIVYERSFRGVLSIQPGKYIETSKVHAEELMSEWVGAVNEAEYLGKEKTKTTSKKVD